MSLKLVPSPDSTPDYYNDSCISSEENSFDCGTPVPTENIDDNDIHMSPDEGVGSTYPGSSAEPQSTPGTDINTHNTETPSQGSTVPPSTDEGIGVTPSDENQNALSTGNNMYKKFAMITIVNK